MERVDSGRHLWGSKSRPGLLTSLSVCAAGQGMIVSRVVASALSDLSALLKPAGIARPLVGVEGHRAPGVAP